MGPFGGETLTGPAVNPRHGNEAIRAWIQIAEALVAAPAEFSPSPRMRGLQFSAGQRCQKEPYRASRAAIFHDILFNKTNEIAFLQWAKTTPHQDHQFHEWRRRG